MIFFFQNSPASPSIEFDSTFSRLLMEKRNQKNDSTLNQKMLDHSSSVSDSQDTAHLLEPYRQEIHSTKSRPSMMENSMKISANTTAELDLNGDDDSFLEMERQCQFEERRQRIIEAEANNTLLSDIEPPPELWEDSSVGQAPILQHLRDNDNSIQLSPMRMVGLMRQSTIVEETSSQCNSTGGTSKNSTIKSVKSENFDESQSSVPTIYLSSSENSLIEKISPLKLVLETSSPLNKCSVPTALETKNKCETPMFTKRKYKFFKDKNDYKPSSLANTDPPKTPATETNDLISLEQSPLIATDTPDRDQFNDTIEAVEFFIEKGKRLLELERTPQARSGSNRAPLETPLFSCKRSRILSEMAAAEMLPIPKRGPLLDLYSSPDTPSNQNVRK